VKPTRKWCTVDAEFVPDSPLEEAGFELLVPLPSRTCAEPYKPALTLRKPEDETRKPGSPEELCRSCAPRFESFSPYPRVVGSCPGSIPCALVNRCSGRRSQEIDQSHETRRWRKADSNRWSHLTYDGDALQNTYSASPGCKRLKTEPRRTLCAVTNRFAIACRYGAAQDISICLSRSPASLPFGRKWDQRFESAFLQRRVRCELGIDSNDGTGSASCLIP
jgi:hypothetical protein